MRGAVFGGFNRSDVLEYVDKLKLEAAHEKEAAAGRFLAELGNYSYHSGLDAGA